MRVGNSGRTEGKHELFKRILERECFALPKIKFIENELTIIDLCAGNGIPSIHSEKSSPQIIEKFKIIANNNKTKTNVILVERDLNTFENLKQKSFEATHLNQDALDLKQIPFDVPDDSACFIHADPNHIGDWPINKELLQNCPKFTTMLVSMGCNVGGLKRLPREEREKWFDRLEQLLKWMPKRHDALVISLKGDKAQWGYLVIGAKVWHDKKKYAGDAKKAFKYWNKGIEMARYKTERKEFDEIINKLFLTSEERDNSA